MDNFLFGLQALASTIHITIIALINHPLVWGFGIGFLISTVIHMLIITDVPHAIPFMVVSGPAESFLKIAPRDAKGAFQLSYTAFEKEHLRVRIAFYLALVAFLFVVGISLLRA